MIKKLYNLKQLQTNQQVLQKQQLMNKINTLDKEIESLQQKINSATVQSLGAIRDFKILAIHKNTMKTKIAQLSAQKDYLLTQVEKYNKIILELNKETEQFKYLKDQEEAKAFKKLIKTEDETAFEYVQAQWGRT